MKAIAFTPSFALGKLNRQLWNCWQSEFNAFPDQTAFFRINPAGEAKIGRSWGPGSRQVLTKE
jgi:hypothetical protein